MKQAQTASVLPVSSLNRRTNLFMLTIGLTGGIGCGKSTAARYFAELGVPVIDSDTIAHDIIKPNTEAFKQVVSHFGKTLLTEAGEINRAKLREIIFKNADEKNWLESCLHPLILDEMNLELKKFSTPYAILVIPLLFEKELQYWVDRVLVIDAAENIQKKRALERDQISAEQFDAILASQCSREKRLAQANDIILNEGTLKNLREQIIKLHHLYLKLQDASHEHS